MISAYYPGSRDCPHPYVFEAHTLGHLKRVGSFQNVRRMIPLTQNRGIFWGYRLAAEDHRQAQPSSRPTRSVFNKIIKNTVNKQVSVRETAQAKVAEVTASLHAFIEENQLETSDSVQMAVLDDPHWHTRLPHEPYEHIRVIFFEVIKGEFYVLRWKDATGTIGDTYIAHVFHAGAEPPQRTIKMVPSELVKCGYVSGRPDAVPGIGRGEAGWFLADSARFIPFKTMEEWDETSRGQPGQSLKEVAAEAEAFFAKTERKVLKSFPPQ